MRAFRPSSRARSQIDALADVLPAAFGFALAIALPAALAHVLPAAFGFALANALHAALADVLAILPFANTGAQP